MIAAQRQIGGVVHRGAAAAGGEGVGLAVHDCERAYIGGAVRAKVAEAGGRTTFALDEACHAGRTKVGTSARRSDVATFRSDDWSPLGAAVGRTTGST
jgi:hypothetical protein